MDALYRLAFPNLTDTVQKKTSEPSEKYNCIGWAFNDTENFWWPRRLGPKRTYWPVPVPTEFTTMQAFEVWFATDGWQETTDVGVEDGYQKVALFALDGEPKHAARLLPNGQWTSKLGSEIDLSHGISDLDGPTYGSIIRVYKKPITKPTDA